MGDGLLSRRRWPAEPSRARVPGGQGRAGTCSPARAGQVCPAPQPGQCPCPLCSGTPSLGGPAEAPEPGGREGRVGEGPGEAERGPQEGRWQGSVLDRCSPLPYPPDFQNLEQPGCESAPNYHCTKFLEDSRASGSQKSWGSPLDQPAAPALPPGLESHKPPSRDAQATPAPCAPGLAPSQEGACPSVQGQGTGAVAPAWLRPSSRPKAGVRRLAEPGSTDQGGQTGPLGGQRSPPGTWWGHSRRRGHREQMSNVPG